ncbi:winged helix-turn-helix transcriptional regulator [Halorutilales archaeon Cl-col2-1]
MDDEPDLKSRRDIYMEIDSTPGIHFRELLRELDYAQGTLQYQLRQLEDEGLVEVSDDGDYTRYYTSDSFESEDKAVMNALRREYSRRIIGHLADEGALSTSELSERIDKSRSTISWHLSRLEEEDVVEKEREGRSVLYSLKEPDKIRRLYTVHRKSFSDRLVDKMLGLWEGY